MQKMIQQVENLGGRMVYEVVEKVDFSRKPYRVESSGGVYEADAVIISTGASPRQTGPGE